MTVMTFDTRKVVKRLDRRLVIKLGSMGVVAAGVVAALVTLH